MTSLSSQKADVVRLLLETEGRVMLCLDATRSGVKVPRRFASDPGLRLILNRSMPNPIEIGALAIESELRFGGIPHYCVLPYESLWGAFNPDTRHGMFWAESMPEEIRLQHGLEEPLSPAPVSPAPAPELPVAPEARGRVVGLRVIEGGRGDEERASAESDPVTRPRPNLRLVP